MTRPKRLWGRIWAIARRIASDFILPCSKGDGTATTFRPENAGNSPYRAAAAIAISLTTVFQLRAVLATPISLSNFSASFDRPKPCGVCR